MRRRVRTLVALATLLVLGAPVLARASTPNPEDVQVIDSVFGPRIQSAPPPPPQKPSAAKARPDPAVAEVASSEPFRIRDARALEAPASTEVSKEVTVLAFPTATTWWGILIGLYTYALPLILYPAWISIALWIWSGKRRCRPASACCGWSPSSRCRSPRRWPTTRSGARL